MDLTLQSDLLAATDLVADAVNVVYGLTHGASIFSAWVLTSDFSALSAMPKGTLLAAFKALDDSGRLAIEAELKSKVNLPDPTLQAKFVSGVDIFERVVQLVYSAVGVANVGKSIVSDAEALVK